MIYLFFVYLSINMGTRGYIIIVYKGKVYYIFNRWDSYPRGLGIKIIKDLLNFFNGENSEDWVFKLTEEQINILDNIKWVTENTPIETNDIENLKEYTEGEPDNWYNLTAKTENSLANILKSRYALCEDIMTYREHEKGKGNYSVYIEYTYEVDFDNFTFKAYDPINKIMSIGFSFIFDFFDSFAK